MTFGRYIKKTEPTWNLCPICGAEFYSKRDDAKTCSPKCRKAFSRSPAGHFTRFKRLAKLVGPTQNQLALPMPKGDVLGVQIEGKQKPFEKIKQMFVRSKWEAVRSQSQRDPGEREMDVVEVKKLKTKTRRRR